MAYEENMTTITLVSTGDLSAASNQYRFVKLDSNPDGFVLAGSGEDAIGVLQDTPQAGEAACICIDGITKIYASATLSAGAKIASGASGVAKASASTNFVLGYLLRDGSNGAITTMLFQKDGIAA